jgi:hypothetical protein
MHLLDLAYVNEEALLIYTLSYLASVWSLVFLPGWYHIIRAHQGPIVTIRR